MEAAENDPVTVVVRHRVKRGKEAQFEEWLRGITGDMLKCPGQQGYHVVRPADDGNQEYLVFFRFDTFEMLKQWEESPQRRKWLEQLQPLSQRAAQREHHTGLEVWFDAPPGRAAAPRWKMLVVTLLAIYPLISLVQIVLVPLLLDWPVMLRTLATSTLLVSLMTYLVMPAMTQLFSSWLYGPRGE